jgi:hypothetical protein
MDRAAVDVNGSRAGGFRGRTAERPSEIPGRLQEIVRHGQGTLSVAAGLGILSALWSARSAMSALIPATNIAYRELTLGLAIPMADGTV